MEYIEIIARFLSFWLDGILYNFISTVYGLLIDIAQTSIFTDDIFKLFANKVYALLGVFMLFKVSFSIFTYIVDPDAFLDKSKGFSKLISNIMITLALLLLVPWIFKQAMDVQRIILNDNIVGKIFSVNGVNIDTSNKPGDIMAYETLKAFYHVKNTGKYSDCISDGNQVFTNESGCEKALRTEGFENLKKILESAHNSSSVSVYMDYDLLFMKTNDEQYVMEYIPIISTLAGGAIVLLLIVFCFDIAVRSVKLGFLRMLAPVPIISRIDPKKGKDMFDKWVKTCVNTYLDLFIRLLGIYFAVFIITQLIDLNMEDAVTDQVADVNAFVKVFIILGSLLFAKQLPKLIEELTGFKMDGKFTLNPLKKMKEVPGVEKISSTAGGTVAGVRAGSRVGNPLLGAALGFVGGYKASTWAGDGKGGFMSGANSAYKKLMGKDFLNFQFKPGGEAAVEQIKEPLKQAYDIKNQLDRELNVAAHQSSESASNLVKNGVDINGDLTSQSNDAKNKIASLSNAVTTSQNKIAQLKSQIGRTKSKSELNRLNSELISEESNLKLSQEKLATNESIVKDIENYQNFSQHEAKIRKALSDVQKDIENLSKEKQQRQSFYGVDPSPAADVKKTVSELKEKGINKYL